MEGIRQSRSFGKGSGELLLNMGSLERGGGPEGKRIIRLLLLLILIIDKNLKGRIIDGRRLVST